MNTLSYRRTDENGLSFELLVDGQPLGELVGGRDNGIPYWIIEDDLPRFPPRGKNPDPEIRLIAVCSCGDYGCGHTLCHVILEDHTVVFCGFDADVNHEGRQKLFWFARVNFDAVVSEMVRLSREYAAKSV